MVLTPPPLVGLSHGFCRLLSNLLINVLAIKMDPDQTAPFGALWSGFKLVASLKNRFRSALEYMQQTLKADSIFKTNKIVAGCRKKDAFSE